MDTRPRDPIVTPVTKINRSPATAFLESGPTMNMVSAKFTREKGVKRESLRNATNIADYEGITPAQERTDFLLINIEAIPYTQYIIPAAVVKEQLFDFILGAPFLIEQEVDLRYSMGKVIMDDQAVEDMPLGSTALPEPDNKLSEYSFNTNKINTLDVETRLPKLKDIKLQRKTTVGQHHIQVTDPKPIFAKPYRIPESVTCQDDREIRDSLNEGLYVPPIVDMLLQHSR